MSSSRPSIIDRECRPQDSATGPSAVSSPLRVLFARLSRRGPQPIVAGELIEWDDGSDRVELVVDGKTIAMGERVVVDDCLAVRVTQLVE